MPVHRTDIIKAHIVEHVVRQDTVLDILLDFMHHIVQRLDLADSAAVKLLEAQIAGRDALLGEQRCHAADVFVDGHAVVIQDDDERFPTLSGVGQTFIGQTTRERTVADQGDDVVIFAAQRARSGHAKRRGNGGRGVPCDERVVHALRRLREACNAAVLPQRGKRVAAAGENFMDVALMAHVKDQTVCFGVVNAMNGDCQLYGAEV